MTAPGQDAGAGHIPRAGQDPAPQAARDPARAWEGFWRDAPPEPGGVFWDAAPERTAARHLPLFADHFTGGLPLLDAGCGNGTQTVFLAGRFRPVLGVDLSPAAIALARRLPGAAAVDFRAADLADADVAARLHAELGDCHVYLRGVLHQCPPEPRRRLAASLAVLLGARGRAFVVEPAAAAKQTLLGLMRRPGGPPARIAAVLGHGIAPMEMADTAVAELCAAAGLSVLAHGSAPLVTTEPGPGGGPVELPSQWLVVGRNG
ncbi:class I SAM-dependent methyltransferase [Streptomyces sp. TRM 70351]|uniref:class I SAM-dependent methyltransferase n=1 Tax=Streptomyces sp. TRM 70351 TaxID=3116552 RepID=UPI002E7BE4D3|nr:class I SAM-dependent methyltransferase [Streptomyces sp. TRM 70351]MEE1926930.1 class I SAM-dependent methyltransferase [Streptomyces sp. TRM 70351]